MRMNPPRPIVLAALCCGVCWGCGPAGSGRLPDLIPVKGKVTYKGKPVTKGTIRFEPDGYGRKAAGKLQPDGTFVLGTDKEGDGVVAGHHRVSIQNTGSHPAKELIPRKYTQRAASGLTADVDAEHTEFPFDLR
jgi:hypothetical protein